MSIRYNLFKLAVKASGVKKRTSDTPENLVRLSREAQAKNPFSLPKDDGDFEYADCMVGFFHCVRIHPRSCASERAILYAYGGGMMKPPAKRYLEYAKQMAQLTQSDVWFPRYPLCAAATIMEAVQMVWGVWQKMLEAYDPEKIAFYGFSSGAGILLSTLLYNAEQSNPLPSPSLLVGISPGECPADEDEEARMRELDPLDIMVSASFMSSMRKLMTKGIETIPGYMVDGNGGAWDALPATYLYYGSNEILSAKAPAFERNLQSAGVAHRIVIREGMCHCYCIAKAYPEAQKDYDDILRLVSQAIGGPDMPTEKAAQLETSSDVKFWDRTAFAYDLAMRKGDAGIAEAARYIASFTNPTDIVLDAACGTGAFACEIALHVGFVAACDLSQKMIEHAEAKAGKLGLENIAFGKRDITLLDFDDDTFDVAIAGNVLHLLEEPRKAVDELVRVTRSGGYIVVPNYFLNGKPADVRFTKAAEAIGFPLKNDWSKDELLEFLGTAGLEVVESMTFAGARPLCVAICKARDDAHD